MQVETGETIDRLRRSIDSVLLGKPEVIEMALAALLGQGHVLIDDVPGVGKTLLARALARSLDCDFQRIQFTPDVLPSDLTGSSIYNSTKEEFVFKPGPLFANVVLADEINRTSPRTQSALLEAMNDRQVSVDGRTYPLPNPFMVLATQNPFEFEGTFPLPESQLDRFMVRITIGYPPRSEERRILSQHRDGEPIDHQESVASAEEVCHLQEMVRQVVVEESVEGYLLDIVEATRTHADLQVGVSTRGALMLYRAAQSRAMLHGREFVVPDDIKESATAVLAHRIISKSFGQREAIEAGRSIIAEILDRIAIPD